SCTGNDCFNFVRSKVLRLIHNHKLLRKRTTTDVSERFNMEKTLVDQFIPCCHLIPCSLVSKKKINVIKNRLHPGTQLLIDIPRKESQVPAHWYNRTGNQNS